METPKDAILLAYDGSPDSQRALSWAANAAERQSRPLHVLVAEVDLSGLTPQHREMREAQAGRVERDARERLEGVQTAVTTDIVEEPVADAIIDAAAPASVVVLGARGHTFTGALVGSVSQHVAQHAPCTVVVVREPHNSAAEEVVAGIDGSSGSEVALEFAFQEARLAGAPLKAIYAQQLLSTAGGMWAGYVPVTISEELANGDRLLAEAVAGWPEKYPEVDFSSEVIPLHPYRALADASEQAALLVVGSRGRGAFARMLLGSVGQSMLHHARCPVAIVR